MRATPAPIPAVDPIHDRLPGAAFFDSYQLAVADPERSALDYFLGAAARTPLWVAALMGLRNRLARLAGLKDLGGLDGFDPTKPGLAYRPGDRVGIFTLIENRPSVALLGDRDRHLDVVLSVCRHTGPDGEPRLSVTTVVHVHNWLGHLYMLPVKPLHKLIAPAVISRIG